MAANSCRLTAPFSGRPQTLQHAGAQDLFKHSDSSPAAKHFIDPGPLQRFVRRQSTHETVNVALGWVSMDLDPSSTAG